MAYLGEVEAKAFLAKEGLPVNPTYEVESLEEALEKAGLLGYPVVLKISSEKIIHKSDVGGVTAGIPGPQELEKAFLKMVERVRPIDSQTAFSLQPHLQGVELAVGISTDPSFGQVIMFGLGGIWIEVLKDVTFRLVPIEERDAWQMIEEIKGKKLLKGIRGYPAVDGEALVRFLVEVSRVAHSRRVQEMDLNPVFASGERLTIADARIVGVESNGSPL